VFRPFVSEVILAKVKSSDEDGIRRMLVSLSPYLVYTNSSRSP
jgi:DNA-directed RNA polymerase subunit E'/Rpb7